MHLRSLLPVDASDIAALWHAGATESAAVDSEFYPRVSHEAYSASVATDLRNGTCIGWGLFLNAPQRLLAYLTARIADESVEFNQARFLYILDLDVHHAFRRQGLGSKLVAAAAAFARAEHLNSIEVSWLSGDARASAFWQRQGFGQYLVRARGSVAASAE